MLCPNCNHRDTRVVDSRETEGQKATRRRRECFKCKHRFTTFERIEGNVLIVVKRDGSREAYRRDKLKSGILLACEKRKVSEEQIDKMINKMEDEWAKKGKEISSRQIGEDLMEELKELDEVAYIRFASVYRQFKDLEAFKKEVQKLLDK